MSTWSLAYWIALVGGAELALRGHLADDPRLFHAGAWLFALVLAGTAWRRGGKRGFALGCVGLLAAGLSALAWLDLPAEAPNPWLDFWKERETDRNALTTIVERGSLHLFGQEIELDQRGQRRVPRRTTPPSTFRIVALGGSTTFGETRSEEERTWPEWLQQRIDALACATPVQVVNAGRVGRALGGTLSNFAREIKPLRPDLIVFYPAPQDIAGLMEEIQVDVTPSASVPSRASALLRRLEQSWRGRGVAGRFRAAIREEPEDLDLEGVSLTPTYRHFLVDMRRRGIDVALATASLAVNGDTPEAEIRLHEALETRTRRIVLANRFHARFARALGASYRALIVDTRPGLDGGGEPFFLDLFHLTDEGRRRLADNVFEELRPRLSRAEPGCTAKPPDV